MHDEAVSAKEAKRICKVEGAELASPTNDDLKDAMLSLMLEDEIVNNELLTSVRTVHTAMQVTGDMKNDPEFQNLRTDTIALSDMGQYKRVNQYMELPYICYRNASQYLELNECGTTDPEYTLNNETHKCYKFHRLRKTWYAAALACLAEGGHLAIINSENEAEVIRKVFEKNPADIIPGYDWRDSAFLGYYALVETWTHNVLTWLTVEEQSLSEAGYEDWYPGEPNNARSDEYCVSVGRNGKLFDDPCSRELPFICEKRPDNCNPIALSKITTVVSLIVGRANLN